MLKNDSNASLKKTVDILKIYTYNLVNQIYINKYVFDRGNYYVSRMV